MAAQTYPDGGVKAGQFNYAQWASIFDARFDEGYQEEINRYGLGSHYMDFLMMAKQTTNVTTRTPKVFEKLEWETTVEASTAITVGAAGADITFTVAASDVDASGNVPLMVDEGIVIPAAYQTPLQNRIYVVTDITGTTVTASPLSADGVTQTASQIGVEVPANTVYKIHSMYKAPGTGQPAGHNSVRAQREYNTQLIKTSMVYEGGAQALKWREIKTESGINSVWMEGQELIESFHSKRIDDMIFLGEENDNAALTEASNFGGTGKRLASKGLFNWGESDGQTQYYSGQWDTSDLYDYKDLIISQNVISRDIQFLYGTDLGRMIEEANLDWVREYSGGSDLFQAANKIGVDIKYMQVNGFTFQFQEIKSFANPQRWGNKAYEFSQYGIMLPNDNGSVTIEGRTERHVNLTLGYLNHGGEDRTRIVRTLDGMSGRTSTASNDSDGSNLFMLTEAVPLVFRPNQIVLVKPE